MFSSRRRFIFLGALSTLWALGGRIFGQAAPAVSFEKELRAWLETLIPSDSISPGAGALHVEADLIRIAKETPQGYKLLRLGILWAQAEAKKFGIHHFSELSPEQAAAIVTKAAESDSLTVPGAFFLGSFHETKRIYYAKPKSWQGLGIERPPQPMGYMDYNREMIK